eukprot:scaffold13196_cov117-Isochrysis_galbana.AAC.1
MGMDRPQRPLQLGSVNLAIKLHHRLVGRQPVPVGQQPRRVQQVEAAPGHGAVGRERVAAFQPVKQRGVRLGAQRVGGGGQLGGRVPRGGTRRQVAGQPGEVDRVKEQRHADEPAALHGGLRAGGRGGGRRWGDGRGWG